MQKLHQDLPRQQADLLVNQLSTFHANVTVTHEKLQEVGQGLPVTLSKSPPTKKEVWAELRQKKKHDRVDARALTAAEAAERDAKQRDKQKEKDWGYSITATGPPPTIRFTTLFRPTCDETKYGRAVKETTV